MKQPENRNRKRRTDTGTWRQTDSARVVREAGRQGDHPVFLTGLAFYRHPVPHREKPMGREEGAGAGSGSPGPLPGSRPPPRSPGSLPAPSLTCQRQDLGLVEQQRAPSRGARGGSRAQRPAPPGPGTRRTPSGCQIQPRAGG